MMMLTLPTAKEVNVTNWFDPEQSLNGGAAYFNKLKNRLPSSVLDPDRTWLALAAYNVGMGHLEDARVITESKGGDPNSWYDVKQSFTITDTTQVVFKDPMVMLGAMNQFIMYKNIRHYQNVLSFECNRKATPRKK